MKSIEETLRELVDKEAIRDLLLAYGTTLDSRDTQGYSDLFSADGEWSGGIGSAKTPAGIKKMLDDVFTQFTGQRVTAFHLMSNMVIHVEGDSGTARSRWTWLMRGADGKPAVVRCGRYEDVLVREDGRWKFRSRRAVNDME